MSRRALVGLTAVVCFPLVVALFVLHSPRWYPGLDWAQTEIRIRDVISTHPPLIGLAGRIGPFTADGGSHPGPISFYALWPGWVLWRGAAYGMQFGNLLLDIVAVALSMWMAFRRGGTRLAIAIALLLIVLMRAYGAFMLTLPWNPYLPVLWWFVFLLAAWSLLDDDLAMLPIAVLAGSFCIQTHIPYLGIVGGVGAVVLGVLIVRMYRRRDSRRTFLVWGGVGLALFAVLWTPPVIDQFAHSKCTVQEPQYSNCGNLAVIATYFSKADARAPEDRHPLGIGDGVNDFLTQLNPLKLFGRALVQDGDQREVAGTKVPGVILVLVWIASAAIAWRRRYRLLLWLDVAIGVGLVFGVISTSRIYGKVWFYLLLWAWALTALLLFAIAWTIVLHLQSRIDAKMGTRAMVAAIAVVAVIFAYSAAHTNVMTPRQNAQLAALTGPTVARVRNIKGPLLVTWLPEPQAIGAEGYGLLNELLRHHINARAAEVFQPGATRYHVFHSQQPTQQVHLATGTDIDCWRDDTRYEQIAYYDPRSGRERATYDQLHAEVLAQLQQAGLGSQLAAQVDNNLFMLAISPQVPKAAQKNMARMLSLGLPAAVFVGPTDPRPQTSRPGCSV